jgi:hypothetical protein
VAEEEAWALRLLQEAKYNFRLFIVLLPVLILRGGGDGGRGLVCQFSFIIFLVQ